MVMQGGHAAHGYGMVAILVKPVELDLYSFARATGQQSVILQE